MSTFIKILKSDDAESEARQVARMKKELEFLTIDLQVHEERLQKMRQK
jgi:hypothetical protein